MSLRHPVVVWGASLFLYVMAITGRSSFGVAGLVAMDRFAINASLVSLFTVVQVGVYAAAQIPVGMSLDRFGSRRVLAVGAVGMTAGQVLLGMADSLGLALVARVLIGAGDATAFASVLRLIPAWFAPRRAPMFTQVTGMCGQIGQILSSLPFAYALHRWGWSPAFVGLGGCIGLAGIVCFLLVRDHPGEVGSLSHDVVAAPGSHSGSHSGVGGGGVSGSSHNSSPRPTVWQTIREPGTLLGFWTHFATCGIPMIFPLMWGVPFLQIAQGWSANAAAAVLIVTSIATILAGLMVGYFSGAHPLRRTWVVLGALAILALTWAAVLLALPSPTWLIWLLMVVMGITNAASGVAFDFVRSGVDHRRLSTATGVVNMGGFTCGLIFSWVIGKVLDLSASGAPYEARDFQLAMASQFVAIAVSAALVVRYRRKTRQRMAEQGLVVPPVREVIERLRRERAASRNASRGAPRIASRRTRAQRTARKSDRSPSINLPDQYS